MPRTIINLNTDWLYAAGDLPDGATVDCNESGFVLVSLPHANVEQPHCAVSWYRKRFVAPADAAGRRILLDFEGVSGVATVYLNGKPVSFNDVVAPAPVNSSFSENAIRRSASSAAGALTGGGNPPDESRPRRDSAGEGTGGTTERHTELSGTPASFDITDFVKIGAENLLAVRVDCPLYSYAADHWDFGGIHRDVALRIVDPIYIKDIFAIPKDVLSELKSVDISATIVNTTDKELEIDLTASIGGGAASISGDLELPARGEARITFGLPGLEAALWDLDNPILYQAAIELDNGDRLATRVGFRTIEVGQGELRLNGKPIEIRGFNRHQTYACIGAAAPARLQARDALILKYHLDCNVVRSSYPSRHFLDACDEIGLLVVEDFPAWDSTTHDGGNAVSLRRLQAMILRDRNRPSIVLWGIDAARDDHGQGAKITELARKLDPTRRAGDISAVAGDVPFPDVFTLDGVVDIFRQPRDDQRTKAVQGAVPTQLEIAADDDELDADGADMTQVTLRFRDENGNDVPLAMPVALTIEGPGVLVGLNPSPMPGGRGGIYVRAKRKPGTIILTAASAGGLEQSITILAIES